jgi:uridine kinase
MCIGKRGTGKTTLTADILYHLRKKFDAGICFSATEESNSFWGKHICDTLIHSEFDAKTYCNFISEQRRINSKLIKPINSFALMEDCMYSKILRNNKEVRGTFFNGRHSIAN